TQFHAPTSRWRESRDRLARCSVRLRVPTRQHRGNRRGKPGRRRARHSETRVQRSLGYHLRLTNRADEDLCPKYRQSIARALAPWLFRIAHNCCIDFLRRRQVREDAEVKTAETEDGVATVEFARADLGPALEHLVLLLPPKERACVLLKDVFDYSLEEIADL